MEAMIGTEIFTQDADWKLSREVLRKQFTRMKYQNLASFNEHLDSFLEKLDVSPGVTDLQPMFYKLKLDMTIAMKLGKPVESFRFDGGEVFSKAFDKASLVNATRARLGDLYFLYRPAGFFKACETIKNCAYHFVVTALKRESAIPLECEKVSLISGLYREYEDLGLIRDQVLSVLNAGRDTTAETLSYALYLLLRSPQVLEKLRSEITTVVGHSLQP